MEVQLTMESLRMISRQCCASGLGATWLTREWTQPRRAGSISGASWNARRDQQRRMWASRRRRARSAIEATDGLDAISWVSKSNRDSACDARAIAWTSQKLDAPDNLDRGCTAVPARDRRVCPNYRVDVDFVRHDRR